jgi:hypothetical protein
MSLVLTTETIAANVNGANVGPTWKGSAAKGVSYFISPKTTTTLNYSNVGSVSGNVVIQGSLEISPSEDKDWVDLFTIDFSNTSPQTISGHWLWMRGAATTFTSGNINISITY